MGDHCCQQQNNSFEIKLLQIAMNQQPIRRKQIYYPLDFLPPEQKAKQQKRFTFNQDYQIQANSIKKYQNSIEQSHVVCQNCSRIATSVANPEKNVLSTTELQQDFPLQHHLMGRKPSLDQDLLKKPRFSLNQKQEIQEYNGNTLENSMSPGCIKRQLQNKQAPLPAQDPCKIQHLRNSPVRSKKIPNSYIQYRSTGQFSTKKWVSSQKDILDKFKASRSRIDELPAVKKNNKNELQFATAREQYNSFRRKQDSMNSSFGKMNSVLASIKSKDQRISALQNPKYDSQALQKLKDQINTTVRNKKGFDKKSQSSSSQNQEQIQQNTTKKSMLRKPNYQFKRIQDNRPQLLVSYRSSLSFLKDLYNKSLNLSEYHLVVKIPKLFIQNLILKGQDKDQLYQIAQNIFYQLKIPHQNLVIKKYTNCTMLIARNICIIWHFDGRRYLGGWQSQYLDQGFKHGLGLEWQPKKYVYYGQYVKNKKHGLGVYKDKHGINYIGYWDRGQRCEKSDLNLSQVEQKNAYYNDDSSQQGDYAQSNVYQYL